jgi:hypothetical protein
MKYGLKTDFFNSQVCSHIFLEAIYAKTFSGMTSPPRIQVRRMESSDYVLPVPTPSSIYAFFRLHQESFL